MQRILVSTFAFLLCSCGTGSSESASARNVVASPPALDELTQFSYRGAFRLSSGTFGESAADFAIGTLAYNPTNHSLFIAGHDHHKAIGEFPVPELRDRPTLAELVEVSPRQNFRRILDEVANPEGINRITGMLYVNGQLIVNAETWYDASESNRDTTLYP